MPSACASSCAIARGALRSVRASWNATGDGEIAERAVRRHFDRERRHVGEAELRAGSASAMAS